MRPSLTKAGVHRHVAHGAAATAIGVCAMRLCRFALGMRSAVRQRRIAQPYSRLLPGQAPVMLVLGDSLAVGLGARAPCDTLTGLLASDYPEISIVNRARSGARTAEVVQQLFAFKGPARTAAICISAGGNDVLANTPLAALQAHLLAALRACRAFADTVVVTSTANIGQAPLFFWPLRSVLTRRTRRVRDLFQAVCAREGVQFVDFFHEASSDPFSRNPQRFYGADGVHPSAACYRHCYEQVLAQTRLHEVLSAAQAARHSTAPAVQAVVDRATPRWSTAGQPLP